MQQYQASLLQQANHAQRWAGPSGTMVGVPVMPESTPPPASAGATSQAARHQSAADMLRIAHQQAYTGQQPAPRPSTQPHANVANTSTTPKSASAVPAVRHQPQQVAYAQQQQRQHSAQQVPSHPSQRIPPAVHNHNSPRPVAPQPIDFLHAQGMFDPLKDRLPEQMEKIEESRSESLKRFLASAGSSVQAAPVVKEIVEMQQHAEGLGTVSRDVTLVGFDEERVRVGKSAPSTRRRVGGHNGRLA